MSRKGQSKIRPVQPDPVYNSITVAKIINYAMRHGKKTASSSEIYDGLKLIADEVKENDPITTLEAALDNIRPKIEVRPRRIGGAVYQVPTPVRSSRQMSLTIRWLINFCRQKPNKQYHSFAEKFAAEILAALKNEGPSVAKRIEVEKMADANKAFSHLRW